MDVFDSPGTMPSRRRYLALWFPWFPCERARPAALPEAAGDAPFALVARVGNALRLAAVDVVAAERGLAPGMTLADARARLPDLATAPHDPDADTALLARLAQRMRRITPMVADDPPHGLVLDITGCAHLFGGEAGLMAVAQAEAAPFTSRPALADTAAAARALARFGRGDGSLHALPVAALEPGEDVLAGLRRAGLATLGDLARRPLAPLAARVGGAVVERLRAILGEVERPIAPVAPPAPIRAEKRFAEPMARTEHALATIAALLAECGAQMAARHLGGRVFVVTLDRADGQQRRLEVETARPVRDPAPVMRLLHERIETLADPLDPGFGFDAIRLAVPRTEPLAPQQTGPDADNDDTLAALIERLATRLGPEHVRRIAPRDSHMPERAQRGVPAATSSAPAWHDAATPPARPIPKRKRQPPPAAEAPAATAPPAALALVAMPTGGAAQAQRAQPADPDGVALRPLLLFDPPAPVTAIAEVPDGPPLRFRWRGTLHEVRLAEGPERIAAEWWRHPQGHAEGWRHLPGHHGHPAADSLLTRDYYRVETAAGERLWIFRHGLYSERASPVWYVHGLFA